MQNTGSVLTVLLGEHINTQLLDLHVLKLHDLIELRTAMIM